MVITAAHVDRLLRARTPRAFVTPALVGLNAAVFFVMIATGVSPVNPDAGALVNWGANDGTLTTSGEWWRLLTAMFVHAGVLHLAANMFGLLQVGLFVERLVGNVAFLVTYILTGILASLTSLYFHPGGISVGASGAIFGIYGLTFAALQAGMRDFPEVGGEDIITEEKEPAVITLGLSSICSEPPEVERSDSQILASALKPLVGSIATFIFYSIVYGFTESGTDNVAHLGGLAAGLVCGYVAGRNVVTAKPRLRQVGFVALAAALLSIGVGAHLRRDGKWRQCEDRNLSIVEPRYRGPESDSPTSVRFNPRDFKAFFAAYLWFAPFRFGMFTRNLSHCVSQSPTALNARFSSNRRRR